MASLLFVVLALTVARMLPVALALLGTKARLPTVAYVGWFGPRGLASIVFAVLILQAEPIRAWGRSRHDQPDSGCIGLRARRDGTAAHRALRRLGAR